MRRRIVAWAIIILFALVLYLFANETATLALLISVVIALPVSFGVLKLTGKDLAISISDGVKAEGKAGSTLTIENKSVLPVASLELRIVCSNLRTGETDLQEIKKSIDPRKKYEAAIEMMPTHAGRYRLSISSAVITDPLGIWSRTIDCAAERYLTVMPEIFELSLPHTGVSAMPESDRQSAETKGAVAGDMVAIREYVPGDPVRNIHWKLSEKTGKMLVKELGNPVTDRFLLLLDSASDIAQDPVALDAVASAYTSLAHALREQELILSAGWTDPATGEATVRRIVSDEDFLEAADEYLAVPASMPSAFRHIERDISENRYAHLVIVGSRIPEGIENISNGCQVTVLMYGGRASFTDRNITTVGFDAATCRDDIAGIEL